MGNNIEWIIGIAPFGGKHISQDAEDIASAYLSLPEAMRPHRINIKKAGVGSAVADILLDRGLPISCS